LTRKFDKYQERSAHYHWRQIGRNLFWFNAYVAARYQQVARLIPRKSKQKILDIGCGDGVLLSLIAGGEKYGLDLDQDGLDYAQCKVKGKFICGSAEALPFGKNFFDVVMATEIIEHLEHPALMLGEIKRVLKPGGRVIITTPIKPASGLTDKLHQQEFSPEELNILGKKYFRQVKIITSHPAWLKKIYAWQAGKIGRFFLDFGRWLINLIVLVFTWNPFINFPGKPTQQLLIGYK